MPFFLTAISYHAKFILQLDRRSQKKRHKKIALPHLYGRLSLAKKFHVKIHGFTVILSYQPGVAGAGTSSAVRFQRARKHCILKAAF